MLQPHEHTGHYFSLSWAVPAFSSVPMQSPGGARSRFKHMTSTNSFWHKGCREFCSSFGLSQSKQLSLKSRFTLRWLLFHFLGPPGTTSVPASRAAWTSDNLPLAWTLERKWEGSTRNAACPYSRNTEAATFKPVFIWRRMQKYNEEYSLKTWKMLELLQCYWITITCIPKEDVELLMEEGSGMLGFGLLQLKQTAQPAVCGTRALHQCNYNSCTLKGTGIHEQNTYVLYHTTIEWHALSLVFFSTVTQSPIGWFLN